MGMYKTDLGWKGFGSGAVDWSGGRNCEFPIELVDGRQPFAKRAAAHIASFKRRWLLWEVVSATMSTSTRLEAQAGHNGRMAGRSSVRTRFGCDLRGSNRAPPTGRRTHGDQAADDGGLPSPRQAM
jgi:hypothetical protein